MVKISNLERMESCATRWEVEYDIFRTQQQEKAKKEKKAKENPKTSLKMGQCPEVQFN